MKWFIILVILFNYAHASRRWVDLSWARIKEASAYDIQLNKVLKSGEQELYLEERLSENKWSKQIPPGKYYFRIRGVDFRDVPGAWSEFNFLDIRLPKPVYINPLADDSLKGVSEFEENVSFEWKRVEGANLYFLEVWNDEGFEKTIYTRETQHSFLLKVADGYKWRVISLIAKEDKIQSRQGEGVKFFLQGAPLETPKVSHEFIGEDKSKVKLKWTRPKYTTGFEYQLYQLGLNQKWTILDESDFYTQEKLVFDSDKLQGEFRLALRAIGDGRAASPYAFVEFGVNGSDLTVHSIRSQLTNELKKDNPFFYSYGIEQTFIDYYGESREKDTIVETTFKGQRYFLEASYQDFYSLWKHRVGFYYTNVSNVEYSAQLKEFHYLLGRAKVVYDVPLEYAAGLFYKDDLFIIGDRFSDELSFETVSTSGPVFMVTPYYRFNRSIDLGGEAKLFVHLLTHDTPNDEEVNTSFSYYLKAYLTYKYRDNETYTGFAGYYVNQISYKASTDGDSVADEGAENIAESSGFSFGLRVNKFF